MKKYIFILVFILFFISSCWIENNKNTDDTKIVLDNNKDINKKIISDSKKYSFEDLYKNIIINNNLEKKWDKDLFKKFVWFFNNNEFLLKEYYFFNWYSSIHNNWEILKGRWISFPDLKIEVLNSFKKYNIFDLSKYRKSIDILNDFDNIFSYTKNTELKTRYYFYNTKKDYFFTLNTLNDINWACLIVSWEISSFKEANKWHIENNWNLSLLDYKKIPEQFHITDSEYSEFLKTSNKINDRLLVYKWLYKIVSNYINSWFDSKYQELFYKKFDEQLNIYYWFSEYTLYFAMKKYNWEIKKWFCDEFNKQYFLAK